MRIGERRVPKKPLIAAFLYSTTVVLLSSVAATHLAPILASTITCTTTTTSTVAVVSWPWYYILTALLAGIAQTIAKYIEKLSSQK